jgi:2'-5' RNA ligase
MSNCGMPSRHHAMLFPRGPQLDEVEALRRVWDPVMAAKIPAHITLVYPDEHSGLEALRQRVNTVCRQSSVFQVRFGGFRAFPPPDDGCVYLEVVDVESRLAALRRQVIEPPFDPIDFPFHLTVIHPRTSGAAAEFWRAGCVQDVKSLFAIDSIVITSSEDGKVSLVEEFRLR